MGGDYLNKMDLGKYLANCFLMQALIGLPALCMAQSVGKQETVISSSPIAASLSKYIDFPVSLSNGIPDISIPLYEFKSTRINIPISLSYHAGGIKVTERTSTMGLGWTLNTAGTIMRAVNGLPDDSQYGFLKMVYPVEGRTNEYYKQFCLANYIYNTYTPEGNRDGAPDVFYFNAPGIGGKFLFRNQTVAGMKPTAATIPYSPIKIDYEKEFGVTRPNFVLTGVDGTVYEFGEDRRPNASSGYSSASDYYYDSNAPGDRKWVISAWQLTRMVSPDGSDEVKFYYEDEQDIYTYSRMATSVYAEYGVINTSPDEFGQVARTWTSRDEYSARLKEIVSKSGKIVFNYATAGAFPALQTLDIYNLKNGLFTKIRTIRLYTSTFSGGSDNALRLDSIIETGYMGSTTVSGAPYKFKYSTNDAPPFNTNSQDMWGYFNNYAMPDIDNNNMLMVNRINSIVKQAPEKRKGNGDAMGKAMLQKITYPTGGFAEFAFEPNQIKAMVPVLVPGQPVYSKYISTINMWVGSGSAGIDETFYPSVSGNRTAQFTFSGSRSCSTPGSNNCVFNMPQVKLDDLTSNKTIVSYTLTQLQSGQVSSEVYTVTLKDIDPTHLYRLYFPNPGAISNSSSTLQYRMSATYSDMSDDKYVDQLQTVYLGGLRVKQITNSDGREKPIMKEYSYTKSYFNSNAFDSTLSFMQNSMKQTKYQNTPDGGSQRTVYYLESPTAPVGSASNSALSYEEVEERIKSYDGKSLGKTVYTFNKALDYIPARVPFFRMDVEFLRRQLLYEKVYKSINDTTFQIVKETQNVYKNENVVGPESAVKDSIKFYVVTSSYDFRRKIANGGTATSETIGGSPSMGCKIFEATFDFRIDPLYYHIVRTTLASTKVLDYNTDTANPVVTELKYDYENPSHLQLTKMTGTNSKNEAVIQTYKYPLDYNYGSCMPVACKNTFVEQVKALETTRLQCEQQAINAKDFAGYDKCGADYDAAVRIKLTEYNTCLIQENQLHINCKNALPENDRAILEMQDRNMVDLQLESASTVGGRLSEKGRMLYKVVAGAGNAVKPTQVKKQIGNFPEQTYQTYASYDNDGNIKEMSETPGGVNVVYLWGYNGLYPVAKISGSRFDTAMSYVNAAILINPSSDQQLRDELNRIRVKLAGKAMVNTFTYAPMIGITSETDAAGVTKYYEYDGLGRLKIVKDKDGKILQLFDYQYSKAITQ